MAIKLQVQECKNTEFTTIAEIRNEILAAAKAAAEAERHDKITIVLPQGKISTTEPLSLSVKENPELANVDITLTSAVPGAAEINSLTKLDGNKFDKVEGTDIFTYQFEKDENGKYPYFHDFFFRYNRIYKAKSPAWKNIDIITPEQASGAEKREGFYAPIEIAEQIAKHEIGATELVIYIEWIFSIFHVERVDLEKTVEKDGKTYALVVLKGDEMDEFTRSFGQRLTIENRVIFFQNSPAYLEMNTFAYDYFNGKFYLNPEYPTYMYCHPLEYPALETIVNLEGIENFTVRDVVFSGTTCRYGSENVYRCGQANTIGSLPDMRVNAAAIFTRDVKRLTVEGCTFKNLGTYGIQTVDSTVFTTIKDNRFLDVSMGAVCVGNPTAKWEEEKNRNFGLTVENNYMKHISYEYPACPAIYVSIVDGLKIMHNTVIDCAYSAVSAGWNWNPQTWALGEKVNIRNAEIAYNYFHNYMQLLRDGGAIYVLGGNGNRFYYKDRFNRMHHNFAMLDELVIHGAKYGYYCDGGSSNWEVSDSVIINTHHVPIFSQPHPHALSYHNTFRNIYSTTERHSSTHVPDRDIVTVDYHLELDDPDALFAKYPEVTAIRDGAGCNLIV